MLLAAALSLISLYGAFREHISGEPYFFMGYKTAVISSSSMEPALSRFDLALIREMDGCDAQIGDILFFDRGGALVVHRFVAKDETCLKNGDEAYMITKGDNNDVEDMIRLSPEDIYGRVVASIGL